MCSLALMGREPEWVEGEILVKIAPSFLNEIETNSLKNSVAEEVLLEQKIRPAHPALNRANVQKIFPQRQKSLKTGDRDDIYRWILLKNLSTGENLEELCREITKDPTIEAAEPNYLIYLHETPNDPFFSSAGSWGQTFDDQWGLKIAEVPAAWDLVTTDNEVIVAVIDSGLDLAHEDIVGNVWTNSSEIPDNGIDDDGNGFIDDIHGWDFVNVDSDPADDRGHGTFVTGIIAATRNNGIGIAGIGKNTKILPLKIFPASGPAKIFKAAQAIEYARTSGARIINMSFGFKLSTNTATGFPNDVINFAHAAGIVLIASAGNDSSDDIVKFPGRLKKTITVGSSDHEDQLSIFSNYGSWLDVLAPGGGGGIGFDAVTILSLRSEGGSTGIPLNERYARSAGTSFAAPFVSGLVSLMLAQRPNLTNEEVRHILRATSDDLYTPGWDTRSGYGRVNARRALELDSALIPSIDFPRMGSTVVNNISIRGTAMGPGFVNYIVEIGEGDTPLVWQKIVDSGASVQSRTLAEWNTPATPLDIFTIRLSAFNSGGTKFEDRVLVTVDNLDPPLRTGWPVELIAANGASVGVADINNDGKKEVLFGTIETMRVYRDDGSVLTGWPAAMDFSPTGPPTIGDIDGDGDLEIGMYSKDFIPPILSGQVSLWHHTGQPVTGWPKQVTAHTRYRPLELPLVFADMDNDGFLEIIYISGSKSESAGDFGDTGIVHIERFTGEPYPGWPQTLGEGNGLIMNSPAIGDVDGDGLLDVAITTTGSYVYLYLNNGSLADGWPKRTNFVSHLNNSNPVAMADVDHDGAMEIVALNRNGLASIFRASGDILSGWPKSIGLIPSSPTFADFDGDDDLEISIGTDEGTLHLLHHDGSDFSGWPVQSESAVAASVVIADLNNDNDLEIISADFRNILFAWNENGMLETEGGFPMRVSSSSIIQQSPLITDLDNDGLIEIIAQANTKIYVWNLDQQLNPTYTPFPETLGGNLRHSRFTLPLRLENVSPTNAIQGLPRRFTITGDHFLPGLVVKLGEIAQVVDTVSATGITFTLSNGTPVGEHTLKVESVNSGTVIFGEQISIQASSGLPITWELTDSNLERALRDVLDYPSGDFTLGELESLISLNFSDLTIASLVGLQVAIGLQTLDFSQNDIRKVEALANLTALSYLDLSSNKMIDISHLQNLTDLTHLNLRDNQINDLTALLGMVNLASLDLRGNFLDIKEGSETWTIIETFQNNGTEVLFDPQKFDPFESLPFAGSPGWRESSWYLNYNVDMWPWIYHNEHGWQFVYEGTPSGVIFLWDLGLQEWLFFNKNTYPRMYLFGADEGWIWTLEGNTPNSRFFQRFKDGSRFSIPTESPTD